MKPAIRQKANIIIDLVMFVVMLLLIIIGFIIRYTLIPGSERWLKYGQNVELTIWGMDRHDWGLIHLLVGLLLCGLLVFHVVLHWAQIVAMIKRLIPNAKIRATVITAIMGISAVITVAPFLLPPNIGEPILGKGQVNGKSRSLHSNGVYAKADSNKESLSVAISKEELPEAKDESIVISLEADDSETNEVEELHSNEEHTLNIRGYNTLSEVADKYNVSSEKLKKTLGIPASVSNNERLGRIRRIYDFTMTDVEAGILKLQEK